MLALLSYLSARDSVTPPPRGARFLTSGPAVHKSEVSVAPCTVGRPSPVPDRDHLSAQICMRRAENFIFCHIHKLQPDFSARNLAKHLSSSLEETPFPGRLSAGKRAPFQRSGENEIKKGTFL